MSNGSHDCMDHKPWPVPTNREFTCPVCGTMFRLTEEWPGAYWEPINHE